MKNAMITRMDNAVRDAASVHQLDYAVMIHGDADRFYRAVSLLVLNALRSPDALMIEAGNNTLVTGDTEGMTNTCWRLMVETVLSEAGVL